MVVGMIVRVVVVGATGGMSVEDDGVVVGAAVVVDELVGVVVGTIVVVVEVIVGIVGVVGVID